MSGRSLREEIAGIRRERRRLERVLNRLGMVLVRLDAHRQRLDRGSTAVDDRAVGLGDTGDAIKRAVDRLVEPGDGESFRARRDALAFLRERRLEPDESGQTGDRLTFFERAHRYRRVAEVSDTVWRVIHELGQFLDGKHDPEDVVDAVSRLVDDHASPAAFEHLHTLVGFAATAGRLERSHLDERLNGSFDDGDASELGLLEAYLEAIDDDPVETLEEQPVVLLPVRLETRFVEPELDDGEVGPRELRIRVYPDQVHVDAHEPELTDEEFRWGETFWTLLWLATHPEPSDVKTDLLGSDRRREVVARIDLDGYSEDWHDRYGELKERAWRQVVERFGRERAAYVVHALQPDRGDEMLAAGETEVSPWGDDTTHIPPLVFPEVDRRPAEWTAQPRARLLPDRWVAYATWELDNDGEGRTVRQAAVTSRAVREPLAVGPDPETLGTMADEATDDEAAVEDGERPGVPAGLEWMVDYDEALRAGMAITITEDDVGFDPGDHRVDTLVVVGVKSSMDGDETAEALRELLDAHHYGDGLEFLEADTPTNNADVPSAYASADDPLGSMPEEIGEPLVETGDRSDGDRLARALAIDPGDDGDHVFAHVGNADRQTEREARHMNNALWPATIGYYLQHLLVDNRWGRDASLWAEADDVDAAPPPDDSAKAMREELGLLAAYRRHFVRYVRGGGPFPALRVGEQPYGVLPVTPLSTGHGDDVPPYLFDPKWLRLAIPVEDGDDGGNDTVSDFVTDGTIENATVYEFGDQLTKSSTDQTVMDGGVDEASPSTDDSIRTDGGAEFEPRHLPDREDDLVDHLTTWLDRFARVWRTAIVDDPTAADDRTDDESAGPRPVPRIGIGEAMVPILEMEATGRDYLRRAVFADPFTIWLMVLATDEEAFTEAEFREIISEVDPDITEAELDAIIGGESGSRRHLVGALYPELEAARDRQREEIRETLRKYDLTELDPRVAHLLYEDALPADWEVRTLERLVDDQTRAFIEYLPSLTFDELRKQIAEVELGDPETGWPSSDIGRANRRFLPGSVRLADERTSLLEVLLAFATQAEYVSGRIALGALYEKPVDIGPDPIPLPFVPYRSWRRELIEDVPTALGDHPKISHAAPLATTQGTFMEAIDYLRRRDAILSPLPALSDFTYSVTQLEHYPAERLERLLSQTLDVASHRLDAWLTSVATRRLFELRTAQGGWEDRHRDGSDPDPPKVAFRPEIPSRVSRLLEASVTDDVEWTVRSSGGAFPSADAFESDPGNTMAGPSATTANESMETASGSHDVTTMAAGDDLTDESVTAGSSFDASWLVDEATVDTTQPWREGLVDAIEADPGIHVGGYGFVEDLVADPETGDTEFIHAPSITHATTAAMLRSAFEAHRDDELGDVLTIDLSADRVRLARGLLEGVHNGQSLGALLGYRFERALHEEGLQENIAAFRQVAPGVMGRLEHGGDAAGADGEPGSTAAKSDVVDGYRLYEAWNDPDVSAEHPDLPWDADAFETALADPIDALTDLLTAESVHQLAKGNVERAPGSLSSLLDGRIPQEPEVIQSPRRRTGVTHRQLVLFEADEAPDLPEGWQASTAVIPDPDPQVQRRPTEVDDGETEEASTWQVRPAGEPVLNAWVAELFPDPAGISYTATFRWTDEEDEARSTSVTATLADLELSALDALYLTQESERAGASQLEGRIAFVLRRTRPDEVPVDAELELEFAAPAADDHLSVAAFLELAGSVRALVVDGRAADGEDLSHPADGLGTGHESMGPSSVDPATALARRVHDVAGRLELLETAVEGRLDTLEGSGDDPNLPARVDTAVEAVTTFAEAAVPARGVPGSDEPRPAPTDRFEVFEERVSALVAELTDDIPATGETFLAELEMLRDHLPAGPTDPDDVDADVTVEAGSSLELTGRVIETSEAESIDVEAWLRSPEASSDVVVEGVSVDEDGEFTATIDLGAVKPGTPFLVIGRDAGDVVYGASGRVVGTAPTPEDLETALETELPTLATLLELASVRDRLAAAGSSGTALETAIHDLASAVGGGLTAEIGLIDELASDRTTLEPAERDAIDTVQALANVTGIGTMTALDAVLAPVDRLGFADLVSVSHVEGEPIYRRGSDRSAGRVRERLVLTDRDSTTLLADGTPGGLLGIDPLVAPFVDDAVSDSESFVASLEALLDAPGWFAPYLDGFLDDAGTLLRELALLLHHPATFDSEVEPAGFVAAIDALAAAVDVMDRLDEVLETDADGRSAFAAELRAFIEGTGGTDLEGFLDDAAWNSIRADPTVEADHDATFAETYETALATSATDGSLDELPEILAVLASVLEADNPARAFRKGVYETARDRLLWAAHFGVYGAVPLSADGGDQADEAALLGQLRGVVTRVRERREASLVDGTSPDEMSEAALAELGVEALVDRLETMLGDSFVVLAPFVAPNAAELERAFGGDRLDGDPLAPETWLQRVAHVRERPATYREALSYAEAATGALHRDLVVGQLPQTEPGPWVGREGVEPEPGQVSFVVHSGGELRVAPTDGAPSSFAVGLAGLFVDEFVEPVPSATQTTAIALNYDDPGARAPQSILLATPPDEGGWSEQHLRAAITETLGLAKLRLVDLEALATLESDVGITHLLPALWFPRVFEDVPEDPSVNFDELQSHEPGSISIEFQPAVTEYWAVVESDDDGGDSGGDTE